MDALWRIYSESIPTFITELAAQPALQRLRQVGMNCGCEYTSFPRFCKLQPSSRYSHSIGTALIIWHYTGDKRQAAAGLLHDIATPVFSHVVDFLNGDHMRQESTEAGTSAIVCSLEKTLSELGLKVEEVADYHQYPIADNPAPRLSADRLEYTMSNLYNYGMASLQELAKIYSRICAGTDEAGNGELVFMESESALAFAKGALMCSEIYVSPEDRYAMQRLALLLKEAIRHGALKAEQLSGTEAEVIACLKKHSLFSKQWQEFCACSSLLLRKDKPSEEGWLQIRAKKRYIDPMIAGKGRVSCVYPDFNAKLKSFLEQKQSEWMKAL